MGFVKLVGPSSVFFIMFALGLNLSIKKFLKVLKNYKTLLTGLICQIIILPIIGLIAIYSLLQYCVLMFYIGNIKIKD